MAGGDFSAYLGPREVVRWSGRPQQGVVFGSEDLLLIPFSIMWCGFALVWEGMAVFSGAPIFFVLWGVPFVCVGLFMVFGRFFWDAYQRAHTWYALSDDNALILRGGELTSIDLRTTAEIRYKDHGSCGTISFGADPIAWTRGASVQRRSAPQFFRVRDADGAYRLIQNARARAGAR